MTVLVRAFPVLFKFLKLGGRNVRGMRTIPHRTPEAAMATAVSALITFSVLVPVPTVKKGVPSLLGPAGLDVSFAVFFSRSDAFTAVLMLAHNTYCVFIVPRRIGALAEGRQRVSYSDGALMKPSDSITGGGHGLPKESFQFQL